jgi:L-ascorbate metabolism protein UlaG (beta-lactamase superfamily)
MSRRRFLAVSGAGAAAVAFNTACGDDGDDGEEAQPMASATATAPAPATVTPGADRGAATIRWFGQAMFLLTTPAGVEVLLDPFNNIGYTVPPPLNSDLATITHEHPDHNNGALAGTGRVLRGLTADGWEDIDESLDDVRITTVRTYHDDQQGAARGRNAVFVYETAGLRLAHLGDLGHQLDDAQIDAIGAPVDVLMVPVGGTFTIDAAGATEVMRALAPRIVFPMHYKTDKVAFPLAPVDPFLEGKPVQRVGSTTMRLSSDTLPGDATVMVLDFE